MQSLRAGMSECANSYHAEVVAEIPVCFAALQPLAELEGWPHFTVTHRVLVILAGLEGTSLLAKPSGGCGSGRLSVNNSRTQNRQTSRWMSEHHVGSD